MSFGVAAPSVPARQFSIEFLFPPDMNSLKQALALMTALHESDSGSQGPSASAKETKIAKRLSEMRISNVGSEGKLGDDLAEFVICATSRMSEILR